MQTIVFLNKYSYSYDCYDFEEMSEIKYFRKVAIIGEDYKDMIPEKIIDQIDKVYVVDVKANNIEKCGLDYLDYVSVCDILEKEIKISKGPENLFLLTADEANLKLASDLRSRYHLFGSDRDDLENYTNKYFMKKTLSGKNIQFPKYEKFDKSSFFSDSKSYFDRISMNFGVPFIIKPISGSASYDVYKVSSLKEFEESFKEQVFSLKEDVFLVEEYIDGTILHCDTLTVNDQFLISFVSEYSCPPLDIVIKKQLCISIPLLYDSHRSQKIRKFSQEVLEALGKINGFSHLELFEKTDGSLVFLEVGARPPGGRSPWCYRTMWQYDLFYEDLLAQIDMGECCRPSIEYSGLSCAWGIIPYEKGRIECINIPKIESKLLVDWYVKEGDVIDKETIDIVNVAGVFTLTNPVYTKLYRDFERLRNFKFFSMEN